MYRCSVEDRRPRRHDLRFLIIPFYRVLNWSRAFSGLSQLFELCLGPFVLSAYNHQIGIAVSNMCYVNPVITKESQCFWEDVAFCMVLKLFTNDSLKKRREKKVKRSRWTSFVSSKEPSPSTNLATTGSRRPSFSFSPLRSICLSGFHHFANDRPCRLRCVEKAVESGTVFHHYLPTSTLDSCLSVLADIGVPGFVPHRRDKDDALRPLVTT